MLVFSSVILCVAGVDRLQAASVKRLIVSKQLNYLAISWLSVHDGPGTRVGLFLRECNLRCPWCHSPHSWNKTPPLLFFESRCLYCGNCQKACPASVHLVEAYAHHIDRDKCTKCGLCLDVCPTVTTRHSLAGALAIPGFIQTTAELFQRLLPQLDLLKNIGGLTISGGEPLLQSDALSELLEMCSAKGIHCAVETSGSVPMSCFSQLIDLVDCWLFGLRPIGKDFISGEVADFETVRNNLTFIASYNPKNILIRTPLIPGYTNQHMSLNIISDLMHECNISCIELLPFNIHSNHYYNAMGMKYPLEEVLPLDKDQEGSICTFFSDRKIKARITK